MGYKTPVQLELYADKNEAPVSSKLQICSLTRARIKQYEKPTIFIIGFIIFGVICFSSGFERGKAQRKVALLSTDQKVYAANPSEQRPDKTVAAVAAPSTASAVALVAQKQPAVEAISETPDVSNNTAAGLPTYTIQIASFLKESSARITADKLRAKGYSTSIIPKGKYVILCVGQCSKDKADALLREFRKNKEYKDCFIRRL